MSKSKAALLVAVIATSLTATGCGTLINMSTNKRVYGGVQTDLSMVARTTVKQVFEPKHLVDDGLAPVFMSLMDLPLSTVADTVTLPVTVPRSLGFGGDSEQNVRKKQVDNDQPSESEPDDE